MTDNVKNQVFAYFDDGDLLFRSHKRIDDTNIEMASLKDVIDYFIQKGQTIEHENEYVTTVEGDFYFNNGDYIELKEIKK